VKLQFAPRYLIFKLPTEHQQLPGDQQERFWALLADKAYVGPATDTPDLRRLTPKKGRLTVAQRATNDKLNRLRVPIEQFFGRVLQSWTFLHGVYRWDHANFDVDFENACLLTNELIKHRSLEELDSIFYHKYISSRVKNAEDKERKRNEQLQTYARNKRARLMTIDPEIPPTP